MQNKSLTLLLAAIVLGLTACSDSDSKSSPVTTPTSGNGTSTNTTQYPLFRVRGHQAYMNGEIKSDIGTQLDSMLAAHPQVDTIVLEEVPGSSDDEANLAAAQKVHQKGLKTLNRVRKGLKIRAEFPEATAGKGYRVTFIPVSYIVVLMRHHVTALIY